MLDRRVFICRPRPKLHVLVANSNNPRWEELEEEPVIITEKVDFEAHLEGWRPSIEREAKRLFMDSLVGEMAVFETAAALKETLGGGNAVEVFDKWYLLLDADYLELATDVWKRPS